MEIYGPEASGKTTLALHVIAESQKNGGNFGWLIILSILFIRIVSHAIIYVIL